jgi:hypothetical protein
VKESGDVFGVYTNSAWPTIKELSEAKEDGLINKPDPSGRSFLFSLVNAAKTPYRVPIAARTFAAIGVYTKSGLLFGSDGVGITPLLWLSYQGKACTDVNGNNASTDAQRAAQALVHRPGLALTMTLPANVATIAGRVNFAAEMIEVYHIA